MIRIVRTSAGTHSVSPGVEDGPPPRVAGTVQVMVVDGADAQVATGTVDGTLGLTYEVPAAVFDKLDTYQVRWSTGSDEWVEDVEVCGGRYCGLRAIRLSDAALQNIDRYPDELLEQVLIAVEDTIEAEDAAAVAFVRRGSRAVLQPSAGSTQLLTPDVEVQSLYGVTSGGVAWTPEQLAEVTCLDGALVRARGWTAGPFDVHYEHGRGRVPPPIRRAALQLVREWAIDPALPSRASATTIGDQFFRLTIAGRDGATGIPDVDVALARYGRRRFGLAMA